MLTSKAKPKNQTDETIAALYDSLKDIDATDPAYGAHLDQLERLHEIKDKKSKTSASFKDWIPVIGSIGGVLVIVAYESFGHTVTSKALSFVAKPKV